MRTGICIVVILVGLMASACSTPLPFDTGGATPATRATATPVATQASPAAQALAAPYDLRVLDSLIRHHQAAVEAAKLAETKAQHRELKDFARQLAQSQQREIVELQTWRNAWYAGQPVAENAALPGMQGLRMSADQLRNQTGAEFDRQFLAYMIPHHQGAAELARDILNHAEHAELKQFAAQVQAQQPREIEQMKTWQNTW